jgi:hypothetical protein
MKLELVVDDEPQIRDRTSDQGLTDWCVSALRFPQFHDPETYPNGRFARDRHFNAGRP